MRELRRFLIGVASAATWPVYVVLLAYAAKVAPWPRDLAWPSSVLLLGLAGGLLVVVALFVAITYRGLRIAARARSDYEFFLATGLTPGPVRREPEEQDMRQRWVSRPHLEEMIAQGLIRDSASIAAYALLLLRGR